MKQRKPKGEALSGNVRYVEARPGEPMGHYIVKVSAHGSRPTIHCEPSPRYSKGEEGKERELGRAWTERVRERERTTGKTWRQLVAIKQGVTLPVAKVAGETVASWLVRWEQDRKARGLQTRGTVGSMLKFLGDLKDQPIANISRDDLEGVVERMDRDVRAGTVRKWKTAFNAWGLIKKAFDDACNSKTRALRVLTSNPASGVRPPDHGQRTAKNYLYPTEFLALMLCERIPLRWKRIFALAVYLYLRGGELQALDWGDVDLERGIVNVHRAIDRQRGGTKSTKTGTPRKFRIEPELLPLLRVMHAESGGTGTVVRMPPVEDWARRLRKYLEWSGCTRAELFADDKTRKQITFYDCRASGISWRAIRGDDVLKIMSAAGHRDIKTTMLYVREADPIRDGFGAVFPELPPGLLVGELADETSQAGQVRERIASPAGFEPAYQG